jgi:hypothetical protein
MQVLEQMNSVDATSSEYQLKETINSIMRRDYSRESTVWAEFPLWDQCPNEEQYRECNSKL